MATQAELDRQAYEDAWKQKMDYYSYIAPLTRKGRIHGERSGIDKGRRLEKIKTIRAFQQLLKTTRTSEAELQNWPMERLEQTAAELGKSLGISD